AYIARTCTVSHANAVRRAVRRLHREDVQGVSRERREGGCPALTRRTVGRAPRGARLAVVNRRRRDGSLGLRRSQNVKNPGGARGSLRFCEIVTRSAPQ